MNTPSIPEEVVGAVWGALKQRCAAHKRGDHDKVKRLVMVSEADIRAALAAIGPEFAALTLVPEGAYVEARFEMPMPGADTAATVRIQTVDDLAAGRDGHYGAAHTLALAITIAALRARSTQERG